MAGISVGKAADIFAYMKGASKWGPKTFANGTKVSYINKGNGTIEKVVERANGTKISARFDNGRFWHALETNQSGTIDTLFGGANYNKIINVKTKRGEELQRMTNKGSKGFIDCNYKAYGGNIPAEGNFTKELKEALAYVRNNGAKNAYPPKN